VAILRGQKVDVFRQNIGRVSIVLNSPQNERKNQPLLLRDAEDVRGHKYSYVAICDPGSYIRFVVTSRGDISFSTRIETYDAEVIVHDAVIIPEDPAEPARDVERTCHFDRWDIKQKAIGVERASALGDRDIAPASRWTVRVLTHSVTRLAISNLEIPLTPAAAKVWRAGQELMRVQLNEPPSNSASYSQWKSSYDGAFNSVINAMRSSGLNENSFQVLRNLGEQSRRAKIPRLPDQPSFIAGGPPLDIAGVPPYRTPTVSPGGVTEGNSLTPISYLKDVCILQRDERPNLDISIDFFVIEPNRRGEIQLS